MKRKQQITEIMSSNGTESETPHHQLRHRLQSRTPGKPPIGAIDENATNLRVEMGSKSPGAARARLKAQNSISCFGAPCKTFSKLQGKLSPSRAGIYGPCQGSFPPLYVFRPTEALLRKFRSVSLFYSLLGSDFTFI